MTPITAAPALAPVAAAAAQTPAAQSAAQFSSSDVERLRALVNTTPQPMADVAIPTNAAPVNAIQEAGFNTLGDSVLQGIASFNTGYNESLNSITSKLDTIASNDVLGIGNNFGDIMALQVEVARWSMSVMGVDNASKAGTNTVKELSKGG